MYYGSEEFNNAIENTQGNALKTRLKFSDEEIIELVSSMRYYGGSNDSDDLMVGNTVSAYVDVSAFTDKMLTGREFLLESGVKLSNGTYEYAPIGYFTVQTPSGDYDEVSFTAYDRMIKFEKVYSSSLTYPTDSATVLDELCTTCGITLATPITNPITITENLKGYTCREVLGYIAGIHGFFACIDRFGELNLRWYSDTPIEKSLKMVWAFDKSQEQYEVEKVEIAKDSETSFTSGNGIITLHHSNPYATQSIADSLFVNLGGYTYMPTEVEMLDDIRLDPWDIISVTYYDDVAYKIPCMSIIHDFGASSTTIKAVGKTSTENEYRFTGPTVQYLNRMATDLLVANRVIATKVDAEYVQAHAITTDNLETIEAKIKNAVIESLDADYADITLANIDIANIEKAKIGELFSEVGLISSAVITDGHVTGYLDAVEVNANKITAGTLAVDRLVFRGEENSIVYELNNITGALQAVQGDTLNGEILTERSITVDKIVANSITANEIATNAITAEKILSRAITAEKLAVDAIKSTNYVANVAGTYLNLADGSFDTAYFKIGSDGKIVSTGGTIGGWNIESDSIWNEGEKNAFSGALIEYFKPGLPPSGGGFSKSIIGKPQVYLEQDKLKFAIGTLTTEYNALNISVGGTAVLSFYDDKKAVGITKLYTNNANVSQELLVNKIASQSITNYGSLTVHRDASASTGIIFTNTDGELGSIAMGSVNGGLIRWSADRATSYTLIDTGNYSSYVVPKSGGTFTGNVYLAGGTTYWLSSAGNASLGTITTTGNITCGGGVYVKNNYGFCSYNTSGTALGLAGITSGNVNYFGNTTLATYYYAKDNHYWNVSGTWKVQLNASTLFPYTNKGMNLGSSGNRWNALFVTGVDIENSLTVGGTLTLVNNQSLAFKDSAGTARTVMQLSGSNLNIMTGGVANVVYVGTSDYTSSIHLRPKYYVSIHSGTLYFGSAGTSQGNLYTTALHIRRADTGAYVPVYGGTYTNSSSIRFKENVLTLTDDEAMKIMEISPKIFDYINGEKGLFGFIAEEMIKTYPNLVSYDDNGNIIGINYSGLIAPTIKVVQNHEQRIQELENQLKIANAKILQMQLATMG